MADEEEGEGCVHNLPICDSRRKAESHRSVAGRSVCVYLTSSEDLDFLDAFSRRYGKEHEEMDRLCYS